MLASFDSPWRLQSKRLRCPIGQRWPQGLYSLKIWSGYALSAEGTGQLGLHILLDVPLTHRQLRDQVSDEERSCYVGELVPLQFQVFLHTHSPGVLWKSVRRLGARLGDEFTYVIGYLVNEIHKIA
jgi:hypothetical protein